MNNVILMTKKKMVDTQNHKIEKSNLQTYKESKLIFDCLFFAHSFD